MTPLFKVSILLLVAGHTDAQADYVVTGPESVLVGYNRRKVYGVRIRLRMTGVPARRQRSSIINRLLQNEHRI